MVESSPSATEPTNALAVRSFRFLWLNSITFFLVMNAVRYVYGWVVLDGLDRDESSQGMIVFLLGLPAIFLLLPAGVWADRYDPKRILIVSQIGLAATMVATAAAMGDGVGSMPILVVSALVAGAMTALGSPVRSAMIPSLLDGKLLFSGIALNAIALTLSFVLGPVSAQLFGDLFGFDGAFWWMAVLSGIGIAALVALTSPGPASNGSKATMRQAVTEGVRFVRGDRGILTLFWLLGVAGMFMSPIMFVTVQAHIKEELGRSAAAAGPFLGLLGLGIAVSSVVIMGRPNLPNKGALFMRAMVCGNSIVVLLGRTTEYWQLLCLGLALGMCGGVFINMNQGLIQANTPTEVMGRVMGLYTLLQAGFLPLGALLAGVTAAAIGTGNVISGAGAIALTLVLVTYSRATAIREMT